MIPDIETIKSNIQRGVFVGGVGIQVFRDLIGTRTASSTNEEQSTDNIIITGGDLYNKGAQAMTFTVVDQLSRRYPQHNIYLFSSPDYKRSEQEKERYRFDILPWSVTQRLAVLSNFSLSSIATPNFNDGDIAVEEIFSNSEFIIDISGYALSSQWGFERSFSYMTNIILARKESVPIYILPQSIGPFDYGEFTKPILNLLFNLYLSYPQIICPREQEGVNELSLYTTHNVQREFDIVLQNEEYDPRNIFKSPPPLSAPHIDRNSIGIVPNSKVLDRMNDTAFYELYDFIIKNTLALDKTIYVLCHSSKDIDICKKIKSRFTEEEDVKLLIDDFNAIELESIIDQFDFLIGSRYHSLIHSYKHNCPVIAIGWATKYKELLYEFDQSKYFFESRNGIAKSELKQAIIELEKSYSNEATTIAQRRSDILDDDLFKQLFSDIAAE